MPCINCKHAKKDILKKDTPCRTQKTILTTHIFCSYWVEVESVLHSCELFTKEKNSIYNQKMISELKQHYKNY